MSLCLLQELTRLNTEAAVVCVLSKVEELVQQANGEGSHWLEELSPLVIKLRSCAEVTAAKAKASLTLITLEVLRLLRFRFVEHTGFSQHENLLTKMQ